MLIAPNNIETNKLVKKRTFNFDTTNRMYGNLVLIMTDTYDDYTDTINAKLFKPQQLYSVYTPRKIKPMNRVFVSYFQKEVYQEIRNKTNNFIKIGKAITSAYVGRNLLYNTIPEYTETYKLLSSIKQSDPAQHIYMMEYVQDLIYSKIDEMGYEKNYIIFPMTKYISDLRSKIQTPASNDHSPLVEFLRTLRHGTFDKQKFANVDRIFFYCPAAQAMVAMDPNDPELLDEYANYFMKITRLNNFNGKSDNLDDVLEDDDDAISQTDKIENTKEKIKQVVLTNVSKKLKANLDDYDAATMDERKVISSIDKRIDSYLSDTKNTEKSFNDLIKDIESDASVASNAISYIESKKLAQKQLIQLSKNLDAETDIINSLDDLEEDDQKTFEPEKVKANLNPLLNDKIQKSSLTAFDNHYNKYQAKQDLVSVVSAFSDQDYLPISIIGWNLVDTSDNFTLKETLTVKYKTDENKTFSFKIDIPKVFNGHYLKIKGNDYIVQKQITRLPIVKTKDDRVEITTNFNKITCERTNGKIYRHNAQLKKILTKCKLNPAFYIEYGYNIETNSKYKNDFEYDELSTFLSKITTMKYEINTNRGEVENEFSLLNFPESFTITNKMTPLGFMLGANNSDNKGLIYLEDAKVYLAVSNGVAVTTKEIAENMFTFIVRDVLHENPDVDAGIGSSYIYSNCKFIGVTYPIFVFCGLNLGLTQTLRKAKVNYKVSSERQPYNSKWVEVRFKNKWMYYEDKIQNTMLLNILNSMHTQDWDYEEFDTDQPYSDYCVNVLGQPIYVKQTVRVNITKLVDPITRDVLKYMKLPTDPFDLLIMASNMLTGNGFIPKNDLCNYRIRGNEIIYAMLYEIIAKAYYKYQNAKLNGSNKESIKIGQNELMSAIISQQNINIAAQLNPILELESSNACSMKGFKGINLQDAYTLELRSFDKSMNGFLATNATPFSGAVGINRSLTVNPKINNVRGYIPSVDEKSLDAVNRLSPSELVSYATSTHADAPRVAMQVGQAKHGVPTYVSHKQLIGSGYDRVVPYTLSNNFCFKARLSGHVESINDTTKIAILAYDDGTFDAIDLREKLAKNSNSGFYINQTFVMKYAVGEKFNLGDVIAYNPSFFKDRGNDCAFCQGTLSKIGISCGDFGFEDATLISSRLSEKCATDITMDKSVAIGANAIIHNMVHIGDHVNVNDELLNFTTSFNDSTTTEFLQGLLDTMDDDDLSSIGNEKIVSKYSGKVTDIDIYYNVPFETLNPSIQDIINQYNKENEVRRRELISKGIPASSIKLKVTGEVKENKINGTEFEGVLIVFYITHKDKLTIGDKLTYSVALKGVISRVTADEETPRSSFRPTEYIDGIIASSGIPSRMTMDIFHQMYANKLLIELGRWIHSEWKK